MLYSLCVTRGMREAEQSSGGMAWILRQIGQNRG